jgi:hypothetical protein
MVRILIGLVIFPMLLLAQSQDTTKAVPKLKWSQRFGIVGLAASISAIVCDAGVEAAYEKYEKANTADECLRYRKETIRWEQARNLSVGLALTNFALAAAVSLFEKKKTGIDLGFYWNIQEEKVKLVISRRW